MPDIPAFLPYTREVVFLDNGELVEIDASSWQVFDIVSLEPKAKEVRHISWDVQAAQKDGYKHFMLKEIFEQPKVIRDCLAGRIQKGQVSSAGAGRPARARTPDHSCLRHFLPCRVVGQVSARNVGAALVQVEIRPRVPLSIQRVPARRSGSDHQPIRRNG